MGADAVKQGMETVFEVTGQAVTCLNHFVTVYHLSGTVRSYLALFAEF
jgi:hypothetical protein